MSIVKPVLKIALRSFGSLILFTIAFFLVSRYRNDNLKMPILRNASSQTLEHLVSRGPLRF